MKRIVLVIRLLLIPFFVYPQCPPSAFPKDIGMYDIHVCNIFGTWEPNSLRPSKPSVIHKKVIFHFPEILFENQYPLWFEFGDGQFHELEKADIPYEITYPTTGTKEIIYHGHQPYEQVNKLFEIQVKEGDESYTTPDEIWTLDGGVAYVQYSSEEQILTHPFIFVEGLDLGEFTMRDPNSGNQVIRYGDLGWDVLSMGVSELIIPEGEEEIYKNVPRQFSDFRQAAYDLILLDFKDGADYIQRNAAVLKELIHKVNESKQPDANGILYENIILGASMGGIVTRIALAEMERDGEVHCTNTFISLDVPHQGANIPLGIQAFLWYNGTFFDTNATDYDIELAQSLWAAINKPAPQQLLYENLLGAYQQEKLEFFINESGGDGLLDLSDMEDMSIDYRALRNELKDQLEELGYPQQTRNIAIANGNPDGGNVGFLPGHKLLDADKWFGDVAEMAFKLRIWSLNGGIYEDTDFGKTFSSEKTLFYGRRPLDFFQGPIPSKNIVVGISVNVSFPSYDNAPGSIRRDMGNLIVPGIEATPVLAPDPINYAFPHCSFIPIISALDIETEDLLYNVNNGNPILNNLTPFEDFYFPESFEPHVKTNDANRNWVNNQLEGLTPGLVTEGVLPNVNGSTYNFGHIRRKVPNLIIQDGGLLQINNTGSTAYLNEPPSARPSFDVFTAGCGADIFVENGGKITLGTAPSGNVGRKGNLYITPGNSLYIKYGGEVKLEEESSLRFQKYTYNALQTGGLLEASSGVRIIVESGATFHIGTNATLRLLDGASLIVEEGGKLKLQEGARLQLWDEAAANGMSNIQIKGSLELNGEFDFEGNGYLKFSKTHQLIFNESVSKFSLTGEQKGTRLLELDEGTTLNIESKKLNLQSGKVIFGPDSKITIEEGGEARLWSVDFQATNQGSGTAIKADGLNKIDVFHCGFYGLQRGIVAHTDSDGSFNIQQSEFIGCQFGLWGAGYPSINIYSTIFNQGDNENVVSAIQLWDVENALLSASTIENYVVPNFYTENSWGALTLNRVPFFKMQGGAIRNNDVGIYVPIVDEADCSLSNIFLQKQANIENNGIGIHMEKGSNSDYYTGMVLMDSARLIHNETGITGQDVLLQVDSYENCLECSGDTDYDIRPNQFIQKPTNGIFHYPLFDICYDEMVLEEVSARGNYWGESGPDDNSYRVRRDYLPSDQCWMNGADPEFFITKDALTEAPKGCSDDPGIISNPNVQGFAGPVEKECLANIYGETYQIHAQYFSAYRDFRGLDEQPVTEKFLPIAAIPNEIRDELNGVCQHYIDVARVMVNSEPEVGESAETKSPLSDFELYHDFWIPEAKLEKPHIPESFNCEIYPNPANHTINIGIQDYSVGSVQLIIRNVFGVKLYSQNLESKINPIDISSYQQGLYIMEILKDNQLIHSEKIVFFR